MLNYNKNKLINKCLITYYETFAHTLDTSDYVPEKYNNKILKYIFKNMKKQFGKIDREDKAYQRQAKKKARLKAKRAKSNSAAVSAFTAGAKAVLHVESKSNEEVKDNGE